MKLTVQKLIVIMIVMLMLTWMNTVKGENFISSCENLSPDAFTGQKEAFVIIRALKISPVFGKSIILSGSYKNLANEKIYGRFIFRNKINIYLTGTETNTEKKFVTSNLEQIEFHPNVGGRVEYVTHGKLHKGFWRNILEEIRLAKLPYELNREYYEEDSGISLVKYPQRLTCKWVSGFIVDQVSLSAIPPPFVFAAPPTFTPYDLPPYVEDIETIFEESSSIKDILSRNKVDIATVLKSKKEASGSSDLISTSSESTEKVISKKIAMTSSLDKVCSTKGKKLAGSFFSPLKSRLLFSVYGLVKKLKLSKAYWYSAEFSEVPEILKYKFDLSLLENKYVDIVVPQNHRKILQNKNIFPVRFEYLTRAPRRANKTEAKTAIKIINILVVGDAPSVAVSGIDKMEKYLLAKSHGLYKWKISWHDVSPSGQLFPSLEFDSFSKLVKDTKLLKSRKRALLSDDKSFTIFLNNFEKAIVKSKVTLDHIVWIKDSYQVPLSTPQKMGEFIKNVHAKGNIKRLKNTNPYKWLYIISGSMPGASKYLIEEPLSRARPSNPGELVEERTVGLSKFRQLLSKPKRLALMLDIVANRGIKHPKFDAVDIDTISINAKDVFSDMGILISLSELKKYKISRAEYSVRYLTNNKRNALLNADYSFAEKNSCTHVYQSISQLGLNWLK